MSERHMAMYDAARSDVERITVVGGSGFIGTSLCQLLAQDPKVSFIIVDKDPSVAFPERTRIADVRSAEKLREAVPDGGTLINLAAEHRDDVLDRNRYHDVNVQGARNVCDIARRKGINRIIFTSTVAVFGLAQVGTGEDGPIAPFNDYGRTKFAAEEVYRAWREEDPEARTLIIVRPTVVFGERNRGNVYNLLRQVASGRFVMIGDGTNRKSIAYVGNVAAFLRHAVSLPAGSHLYNYVDKPDFTMNELIATVNRLLGRPGKIRFRLPLAVGLMVGRVCDVASMVIHRPLLISSVRVKKFCADTMFSANFRSTGFVPPTSLQQALERTVRYEFVEPYNSDMVFFTE